MQVSDLTDAVENSISVPIQKFVLLSTNLDDFYAFFEGKDAPYYSSRINHITGLVSQPIVCGNKKNVIAVCEHISKRREYDKYSKGFFVDSDFDDSVNKEIDIIYETPCYSIENLYSCRESLIEILKSEFNLSIADPEFNKIVSIYDSSFSKFNECVRLFNAWYSSLKYIEKNDRILTKVQLNDKLPAGIVEIKDISCGDIVKNYNQSTLETLFPQAPKVDGKLLHEKEKELNTEEKLRGKYQLYFFLKFLDFVIDDANKSKKILKKKTKFQVAKGQALSQLSIYAKTPTCLFTYLKSRVSKN